MAMLPGYDIIDGRALGRIKRLTWALPYRFPDDDVRTDFIASLGCVAFRIRLETDLGEAVLGNTAGNLPTPGKLSGGHMIPVERWGLLDRPAFIARPPRALYALCAAYDGWGYLGLRDVPEAEGLNVGRALGDEVELPSKAQADAFWAAVWMRIGWDGYADAVTDGDHIYDLAGREVKPDRDYVAEVVEPWEKKRRAWNEARDAEMRAKLAALEDGEGELPV